MTVKDNRASALVPVRAPISAAGQGRVEAEAAACVLVVGVGLPPVGQPVEVSVESGGLVRILSITKARNEREGERKRSVRRLFLIQESSNRTIVVRRLAERLDREALAQRKLPYEKLDQLVIDLLLGV